MYVLAFFNHSRYVEMAFTELELKGIPRSRILAVPLDKQYREPMVLDSFNRSDGRSLLDGAAVSGTVFMVLGVIYGFVWKGGPILWGLVGLILGALLGFLLDYGIGRLRRRKRKQPRSQAGPGGTALQGDRPAEISVIVNCQPEQSEMVERVLWQHFALAVGEYEKDHSHL
ncbi:MAG: hypothetical protein HPY50_22320 [Firmicutes bacterium]|nr:hypothetical protein [Bacillota bacterium]